MISTSLDILSKTSKEEMNKQKAVLEQDLKYIRDSFKRIPDEMIDTALAIKKKYVTPRRTRIPNYIGYVRIGGGVFSLTPSMKLTLLSTLFQKQNLRSIFITDLISTK